MKTAILTVKAQKSISKRSEEELSNGLQWVSHSWKEERNVKKYLEAIYDVGNRSWHQIQYFLKKLPQKAQLKYILSWKY